MLQIIITVIIIFIAGYFAFKKGVDFIKNDKSKCSNCSLKDKCDKK